MRLTLGAMLLVLVGAGTARADTVTFKNGDKLTGTLVNVRDGSIALKSDVLGDISIPLAKVETFSVEKTVVLLGKQTELARGQASLGRCADGGRRSHYKICHRAVPRRRAEIVAAGNAAVL